MAESEKADVTQLLIEWSKGSEEAFERLAPLVYQELRKIARSHMRRERQDHTLQPTALVNEAFQTLKNPLRRGRYLLQLRGIDTDEEIDTAMDSAFLMEQMELRESLDAACDSSDSLAQLHVLGEQVVVATDERITRLRDCLSQQGDEAMKEARNTRSEERRVGKECRSRWSPYP